MTNNEELKKEIAQYRKEIDEIDDKIVDLLNKRGNFAIKLGEIKKKLNLDVFQPQREREVIERIKNKSTVFKKSSMEIIWNEILGASKVIQGSIIKTGYLGPIGTFTHQAALEIFPKSGSKFIPYNNSLDIFNDIEKDIIEFGVIPIENSLQGTVLETIDILIEKELLIYSEIELRIIQNLIGLKDAKVSDLSHVYSHPQAFAQTRLWIKENLPNITLINVSSTAEAVRRVHKLNDKSYGAIGTAFACQVYDLEILKSKIEDEPMNYTRFLVISKRENPLKTEKMKTSVVFATKHVPGALYNVLKVFSDAKINLTKIESRPSRKVRWEYIFFMDFEGDKDEPHIKEVLQLMKANVIWHKILGSYPMK
ncbi:MAG: prephenate dehydratase [Candidatus Hermodarchaeota archaeon]